MSNPHRRGRRGERGTVMVMAALAMTALILFGALVVDVGGIWASRTQLQNVDDAAALAAAKAMISQTGGAVDIPGARTQGSNIAAANSTLANPSVAIPADDVHFQFGKWNFQAKALDTSVNKTNPELVTGVRVTVAMDGSANARSPSFLSQILGLDGFDISSSSTAYLGFAGDWPADEFDLPIAIDSCNITGGDTDGDGCRDNFCATVGNTVQTLNFTNSPRNACWTAFEPSGVSESDLLDAVAGRRSSPATQAGDSFDLDDNLPSSGNEHVIDDIGRRFNGDAPYSSPMGQVRHSAGTIDSWVVKLPVVECQNGHHCRNPGRVTGSVCFEIRDVDYDPTGAPGSIIRRIRGQFLCPNSTNSLTRQLYDQFCRTDTTSGPGSGPGGCNFGMRADKVVLVQ